MQNKKISPFNIKCYSRLEERFASIFEPALINEICESGVVRTFTAEDVILDIGDTISMMPLVLSGSIKVMIEDEAGDELVLYYLEIGETCAVTLNCCTTTSKSGVKAIAETNTEVLMVPVDKMDRWMVGFQSWRAYVLNSYNERFNEMVQAIDLIVFHSLEERLRKYLNDKAWMAKTPSLQISHQDIANDLHASRVAVSRLMKKLELDNYIQQHRGRIVVSAFDK